MNSFISTYTGGMANVLGTSPDNVVVTINTERRLAAGRRLSESVGLTVTVDAPEGASAVSATMGRAYASGAMDEAGASAVSKEATRNPSLLADATKPVVSSSTTPVPKSVTSATPPTKDEVAAQKLVIEQQDASNQVVKGDLASKLGGSAQATESQSVVDAKDEVDADAFEAARSSAQTEAEAENLGMSAEDFEKEQAQIKATLEAAEAAKEKQAEEQKAAAKQAAAEAAPAADGSSDAGTSDDTERAAESLAAAAVLLALVA